MKTVSIVRKWNNPEIIISVTGESMQLDMSLTDFVYALTDEVAEPLVDGIAKEAGNPAFWFTREALTRNLIRAIEGDLVRQQFVEATARIVDRVKQETTKVL